MNAARERRAGRRGAILTTLTRVLSTSPAPGEVDGEAGG